MGLNCPCDLQCREECEICRDNDTAEKAKRRYEKIEAVAIRSSICYKCGKEIIAGSRYIYESWIGDKIMVNGRKSHIEC